MKVFQNGPDELHEICGSKKNAESCFHTYNLVCFQITANSLRASDRFVQPVFLRIFRCIGAFNRGNGCLDVWIHYQNWSQTTLFIPNFTLILSRKIYSQFLVQYYLNWRRFQKHKKLTKIRGGNRWSDYSCLPWKF